MTRALAGLAVALVLAAGCGDAGPHVDTARAERDILAYLRATFPAATFTRVDCPAEVDAVAGGTFTCRAPVGDDTLDVKVTQDDEQGTHITYVPAAAVVVLDQAEVQIGGVVAPQFTGQVTVDCGADTVRVFPPGTTFECKASDPLGDSKTVRATVKDIDGALDITVV